MKNSFLKIKSLLLSGVLLFSLSCSEENDELTAVSDLNLAARVNSEIYLLIE